MVLEWLQALRLGRENGPVTVAQAALNAANPTAYNTFRLQMALWFERAAEAGVTQIVNPLEGEGEAADLMRGPGAR